MPRHFFKLIIASISSALILLAMSNAHAQQQSTDGTTPLALQPGAPAGSYPLSDFDNVNLFNGSLNFSLPLVRVGGRGNTGYPIMLRLDQKWIVSKEQSESPPTNIYYPQAGWWTDFGFAPMYSMGRIEARQGGTRDYVIASGCGYVHRQTLTRLTFTAPDGTEYELRDQQSNGQPAGASCTQYNRGTVFVTADGTGATFISDAAILDYPWDNPADLSLSGYMMLKDGSRYRILNGDVSWMRDRNGNKLVFGYDTFHRMTSATDSLNREVTVIYGSGATNYDQIVYKGFGGATRTIKVYYQYLQSVIRSDLTGQTLHDLFPDLNGVNSSYIYFDPVVVSAIELPNGKQYQFRYDGYLELSRVTLPTGGAIEYDYAPGLTDSPYQSGVVSQSGVRNIYRRVIERRVYPDGGSGSAFATRMTYSRPESSTTNSGYVDVDQYNAAGSLLGRTRHYYYGSARASLFKQPTEYPAWTDSREYKTETFDSDGYTLLRRSETNFEQRTAVSWWTGGSSTAPPNDVRAYESITTLGDTNQVSKQTFGYDDSVPFNNQNNVKEYDFGGGAPGPLRRETRTTYLTSSSYTGTDVHLRSLPLQVSVYDGSGVERARTTTEYDNYTVDGSDCDHAFHCGPLSRGTVSGFDSNFGTDYTTRGNATGLTRYLLVNGSVTGSITTYTQYDILGNEVRIIDPRSTIPNLIATKIDYDDCFGVPNGNARTNSAPLELAGLSSFALPTKVTNAMGHVTWSQFDFNLGRPVDAEDANGIVASGYYDDSLDRPTQIKRAVLTAVENQTTFTYDDTNRIITTTRDRDANNDNLLVSKLLYDQLGRTSETRQYEGGANYIAVQTQYDALGRAFKTSNPFRPWQSETPVWTTTAFDALGRVLTVTTPDNAVVNTSYSGNTVTVMDQAGKTRKSVTDALGRLASVYEDPNGLNYLTSYSYDALDNLTQVLQGEQTRTFVYDSLKRLTSAKNPESGTNPENGTISYQYDNNGNLTQKTDARGWVTTLGYDALNRVVTTTYANDGGLTPPVSFYYDNASLPAGAPTFDRGSSLGRLVAVTYGSGSSAGTYRGYDQMGRVVRQYQRTDSINYLVEASYYANSTMQSETYPSVPGAGDRRTMSYANDGAGRLASMSTAATSYAPAASVSNIGYASHSALSTETYGNGATHSLTYNNRLQPIDIKLTVPSGRGFLLLMDLAYDYGTTNNNGNLNSTSYSYSPSLSYTQTFSYDTLNRLTTASETNGSTTNWTETNAYDRYGNRWLDLGGGSQNLTFGTSNNRITTSGFSYDSAGNLTNDGVHSYAFDAENKIVKLDAVTAYSYDGEGHRVKKLVGENTRFIYGITGELIAEFDGSSGNLRKEYVNGGVSPITIEPTAVNANGTQYATSDHLGTPRVVMSGTSFEVVSRHDYKPFGEEIPAGIGGRTTAVGYSNGGDTNRNRFTAKERDAETGLDYFGERYYSSTIGRFASVDPLGGSARIANPQTMNRYTFVLNNPLRYVDPDGLEGIPAWTQLTDEQKKILAPKLIKVQNPNKLTSTELKRAGEIFNSKVTVQGNDQATRENVTTVQNFIDTVAGGGNSEVWQQINKIDSVGRNTVSVDVKDKDDFLSALKDSGFVINPAGEIFSGQHPNDSARQVTELSANPALHFANDDSSKPNRFFSHWDPTSPYFRTQTFSDTTVGGVPIAGSGLAAEKAWAGQQHGKVDVSPAQIREFLKKTQKTPQ